MESNKQLVWKQKCEYLVYCYIRHKTRDSNLDNIIPNEIKQQIMIFLGDIFEDEWDVLSKGKWIHAKGNKIENTAPYGTMSGNSIFGTKVIVKGEKFRWKVKMIKFNEFGNRHCFFGVIAAHRVTANFSDYFVSDKNGGYGYCHRNGFKYHNAQWDFDNDEHRGEYGPSSTN